MKYLISFLMLFIAHLPIIAQSTKVVDGDWFYMGDHQKSPKKDTYLDEDWSEGSVFTKDSILITNLLLKYNVSSDRIEFISKLQPRKITKISIGKKYFIYSKFYVGDALHEGYFELLNEGPFCLLKRRTEVTIPGRFGVYGTDEQKRIDYLYYLKHLDEPAQLIEDDKNSLLKILKSYEINVEEIIKKEDLNLKKKRDIIKLLTLISK